MVVKNSEMVKDYSKMKNPRLDLLVEFDDRTTVDLEMQLRQTKDNLPIRFSYYLARLHGSQELVLITKLIANTVFKLNCTHN